MPLYGCVDCHHEWEVSGALEPSRCDWCSGDGVVIQEKTHFDAFMDEFCDELKEFRRDGRWE
jgi:hypothetical protein